MPQSERIGFDLWLRLGTHAEKDYAIKTTGIYDCIVLNANLVAATPGGSASLVLRLQKPFVIDPMTYAFALNPRYLLTQSKAKSTRGKLIVKKTYELLGNRYGPPVAGCAGRRRTQPSDFTECNIDKFVSNVYEFQIRALPETWEKEEEFRELAALQYVGPYAVVSPYFYMSPGPRLEAWVELNARLATAFRKCVPDEMACYVPVCFDEVLLDSPEVVTRISEALQLVPCTGYLIWVSDLREQESGKARLRVLTELVRRLSMGGEKRVVNAHGGFFSCALRVFGMTGVSHGVGYGEHRDVTPVLGGGLPPVKYYYPPLKALLIPTEIETILPGIGVDTPRAFHERVCDCSICRSVISNDIVEFEKFYEFKLNQEGNEVATPEAYNRSRFHYLLARKKEIDWLSTATIPQIVETLRRSYGLYEEEVGLADVDYLETWAQVLNEAEGPG